MLTYPTAKSVIPWGAEPGEAAQHRLCRGIVEVQATVIEEPRQSKAPVERIAECCCQARLAVDRAQRSFGPREECSDERSRAGAPGNAADGRLKPCLRIDRMNRSDPAERLCGER